MGQECHQQSELAAPALCRQHGQSAHEQSDAEQSEGKARPCLPGTVLRSPTFVAFWKHFSDAEDHHVIVVAPTDDREERIRRASWRERPHYIRHDHCCSFWTTTAWRVRQSVPAAEIWLAADVRADEAPRPEDAALRLRTALARMTPMRPSRRTVDDCIGKPDWWLHRPGGGQVN